jgi:mxaA protein
MKRLFLLFALGLLSCSDSLNHAVTDFVFLTPRPFAYRIGDEIVHQIEVNTHHGVTLNKASLPMQGVKNRWLNINQVQVTEHVTGDTHHYQINLRYQVFYAPQTVKQLSIPSFSLLFNQGQQGVEQVVPTWQFTVSPLHELELRAEQRAELMRPSLSPPLLTLPNAPERLLISGAVFFCLGFYLAYLYGYLRLPKRKVFVCAKRQLAKTSEHNLAGGLTIVHQALNTVHGKPLFVQQLPAFYQQHPRYQAADSALNDFFRASNDYFFTGNTLNKEQVWQTLKRCCQLCADIEQGLT